MCFFFKSMSNTIPIIYYNHFLMELYFINKYCLSIIIIVQEILSKNYIDI